MTTQTNKARPADPSIPYPALHWDGDNEWKPQGRSLTGIVAGIAVTALFIFLTIYVQVISETEYVLVIARVIELPAIIFTVIGILVGIALFAFALIPNAPWFQSWSYLEVREEEDGLRVFAGRKGKDHPGVLVRRNETLVISGSRGDALDEAELTVKAPAGELDVNVDTFLKDTTMVSLEEAAARYGIEIRLEGVATEIPRASA